MIGHVLKLVLVALIGAALIYVSRFWGFALWGLEGLFGIQELRPQGDLLARWLRGTDFRPFDLIIWVVAGFLILTWVQKLFDWLSAATSPEEESKE